MRFLHTADWHLGRLFHGVHLTEDQAHLLEQFVDVARQEKPDAILIAGDVYDRAVPPPDAVTLLNDTISELVLGVGTPVIMISGNHDSPERLGFGSALLSEQQFHVVCDVTEAIAPLVCEDEHGPVDIFCVPYVEPAVIRSTFNDESISSHAGAMEAVLTRAKGGMGKKRRRVLVAHAFVSGGEASESERPLTVGGAESVPKAVFKGFDYIALGHLHRPQSAGGTLRYAGSLMKYSFSEAEHEKSVSLVEMDKKGKCKVETVTLSPLRDVRRVKGHLKSLLAEKPGRKTRDDYIMVTLLDKGAILDAIGKLREVYPNVLHIERPHLGREGVARGLRVDHREMTEEDLFSAFFQEVTGDELTAAQRRSYTDTVAGLMEAEREVGR